MHLLHRVILCTIFTFISFLSFGQNLITNGHFTKDLEGWDIWKDKALPSTTMTVSNDYQAFNLADNFIGTNFVVLRDEAGIQQTFSVEPETEYILQFGWAQQQDATKKQLIIEINGEQVESFTVPITTEASRFKYENIHFTPHTETLSIAIYVVTPKGDSKKGVLISDVIFAKQGDASLNLHLNY